MFKYAGDSRYIYKNRLDSACFQHDMAYGDIKDLSKRTAAINFLRDKVFNTANDPKYDGYQQELASMVYKFYAEKTAGSGFPYTIPQNENLVKKLHKAIFRKFKKIKVYSALKTIFGVLI